jgi:DNA-binding XRE family transcriptional regulator
MATESERETTAARWLIEQDDPDFSDEQQEQLVRWIMQGTDNCRTYTRLVRAWRWAVLLHRAEPPIVHKKKAPAGTSSRQSQINRAFGRVLRARREELGLAQFEVADLSGIDPDDIHEIESGAQSPTLLSLYVLAKGLKVSAPRLISQLEETLSAKAARPKRKSRK